MLPALLFFLAALAGAQDTDSAARELARKIAGVTGRQDVSLTVRNSSSLPEQEAVAVARVLETELHQRPLRPGADRVAVNVTLSENVQSYLWVAQIQQDVVMVSVARQAAAAGPAPVTIQKKLLWEQEKPILDAAISESLLIVLDATGVTFYRGRQLTQSFPISNARPMPRDLRGRLIVDRDSIRAFLPGVVCSGSVASMACAESNAPWPLDGGSGAELAAGRNYFNEPRLPAFFSTATLTGLRLIAGVDGRTRLYDGTLRETGQVSGWGSDIVAVESGCHSGWQALASKPGDAGEPDAVQAYDLAGSRSIADGEPVTFPGPVTALWPSGRKAEAMAIARNVETGKYAAYSLAITCDR